MTELAPTPRTTVRRMRARGSHERDLIYSVLDEGVICHVGFAAEHGPVVLPMVYARDGDVLFLHGAAGNDMLRHLAAGTSVCVTVTLVDGMVLARSAFHHSMNYRSVVLFGTAARVTDPDEVRAASRALVDHIAPGRAAEVRPPNDREVQSTLVVRLPITEGSAKVRTGGPIDDDEDLDLPVWAGVLPLATVAGAAVADGASGVAVPLHVAQHRLVPQPG